MDEQKNTSSQNEKEDSLESMMKRQHEEREKKGETGFYVVPKTTCYHIAQFKAPKTANVRGPCGVCGHVGENWVCLVCGEIYCSRYVSGHMLEHNQKTGHALVVSFSDFSCWCYECDSYIKHHSILPLLTYLHKDKFGFVPQNSTNNVSHSNHSSKSVKDPNFANRVGAITDEEEVKEFQDPPEELEKKVKIFVEWMRKSSYMVAYTGAGISTSSGIPDYRGPNGVWTLKAQGKSPQFTVTLEQALPTSGHMALKKLEEEGILKYLISTNVDGLHKRSGIPSDKLAELHGNIYLEKCSLCGAEYLRPFDVTKHEINHFTGRKCEKMIPEFDIATNSTTEVRCSGKLRDSIINFGESLPPVDLQKSIQQSRKADLRLVLGTSLRVSPANKLPFEALDKDKKAIIVNLQKTPYDDIAHLRIFAKTDDFLTLVMKELNLQIPKFELDEKKITSELKNMVFDDGEEKEEK